MSKKLARDDWWMGRLLSGLSFLGSIAYEVARGAWRGDLKLLWKIWFSISLVVVSLLGLDGFLLQYFGKSHFYRGLLYAIPTHGVGCSNTLTIGRGDRIRESST